MPDFSDFGNLGRAKASAERKCCGEYPAAKPYTHRTNNGKGCCGNKYIFDSKSEHCCENGRVEKIGDVCWNV